MKQFFTPSLSKVLAVVIFTLSVQTSFASNKTGNEPQASFEVQTSEKWVSLKWMAAADAGFNHYEVERSFDGQSYKTVGLVMDGFDAANAQKAFQFRDKKSDCQGQTQVYYRMKQVNKDGSFTYSSVVKANL